MSDYLSLEAFIFVLILMVYVLTAHFIEICKVPFLHESGVAILMGLLTALLIKSIVGRTIQFDNEFFFTIILPPIIFSAGYSLRKSLFFGYFSIIGFLGIIGTIISFICLSAFILLIDRTIFHRLSFQEILLLSSVLCATDTVAAISLIKVSIIVYFRQPEKYPILNAILFGEGIINDAVSIILFKTVQNSSGLNQEIGWSVIGMMGLEFVILLCCSVLVGLISGFALSYLLKVHPNFSRFPIKETSLIMLTGYSTYLLGQILSLSGIITLFTSALIMGHYAFMNISSQSQRATGLIFQTISYIAQAFVYAYLGASLLSLSTEGSAFGFAGLVLLIFPAVRGLVVFFMPCIYRLRKKKFPISGKQLKITWYSGMVRGVIAFALCLQIQSEANRFISSIVMMVVMVTTLLGATMLKSFAKYVGMYPDEGEIFQNNSSLVTDVLLETSHYTDIDFGLKKNGRKQPSPIKKKLSQFQNQQILPIFTKEKQNNFTYQMQNTNSQI